MPRAEKPWTEVVLRVPPEAADALGARCIELGAPGVVTDARDLRRTGAVNGSPESTPRPRLARFTAYFPPHLDPLRLEAELRATLDALARELPGVRRRTVRLVPFRPPTDRRAWRRHFPPIAVGRRLAIAPSWCSRREVAAAGLGGRLLLRIDPAQAFGTGHHPTTRGCLVALERVCTPAPLARGLDVGSGSGVLAVAMRALGVREVTAIDVDPAAQRATAECARANRVTGVRVVASLGRARGRFDVIAANLFAGLLVELAPRLAARLRPGGVLVASGLLASQEREVGRALRAAGLRVERRECRATWTTLTVVRPHEPAAPRPAASHAGPPPAARRRR